VVEHARGIVEDKAVDLPNADDDLERMAQSVGSRNEGCNNEAERAPGELPERRMLAFIHGSVARLGGKAYSSDCLHAKNEGIRSQVSRVGESVFLP
jgi:hypothetical protein